MRIFSSKYVSSALVVLALAVPFVWAGEATIRVGNAPPVFEDNLGNPVLPNDGWSSKTSPTQTGNEVTFTATATDPNGDDYYLAICKSDAITPNGKKPPTCDGGAWAVSDFAVKSSTAEILTYEIKEKDVGVNEWFAFVCDAVKEGACSDAHQGEGGSGSPFYTPRLSTVLRFGDDCPAVAELDALRAPEAEAAGLTDGLSVLEKPLTRPQVEQMIEDELVAEGEDITSDLKLVADQVKVLKALEKTEAKASKKEKDAVADAFIAKRDKLKKLAENNVRFCVVTDTDGEGLSDVVDKKEKSVQEKSAHRIDKKDLKLNFRNDADRRIEIGLKQSSGSDTLLKSAPSRSEGPAVRYKDPDSPNRLVAPEATEEGIAAYPDVYQTFTLRHETTEEIQDLGDVLVGLFGKGDTPAPPDTYQMNVLESIPIVDPIVGPVEEEVIYQSADNRKTDIYKTISQPTSLTPYRIKNYTLYHYGDGAESELYTIENAVLHRRADGVIEGYYAEPFDLSQADGAEGADEDLLARASRVMEQERRRDLHENGGDNPDFTIPAPFVLDRNGNVIETAYTIAGEPYNQLSVSFTANTGAYPLALDPSITFTAPGAENASEHIIGATTADRFGWSVVAGDLDNDGDDDLAVGGPGYDSKGRVYIFYNDGEYDSDASNADTIISSSVTAWFGSDLALGDMNGDGQKDLIVGARTYSSSAGAVYIFYNDNGYASTLSQSDADITITGESVSYFGSQLAVGDLDGDGDDDLVVGAYRYNSYQGRAYIFNNDGSIPTSAGSADTIITGNTGSYFGYAIAVGGDLDNDNTNDLMVTAPRDSTSTGAAYIFNNDGSWPTTAGSADTTFTGEATYDYFGESAVIGDLDGDGDADFAVGAYGANSYAGRVYLFENTGATWGAATKKIEGDSGDRMGYSLAIGDLNRDGNDDLVTGSYYQDTYTGYVCVFHNIGSITSMGSPSGYTSYPADADVVISGPNDGSNGYFTYLNNSLAIGDLNGDGANDLVVGGIKDNAVYGGQAFVFYGEGGLEQRNTITGDSGIYFAGSLATGDFDADGTTDLAVGAPYYSTQTGRVYIFYNDGSYGTGTGGADHTITGESTYNQFGREMAVGDMDSDGTDDLIVAAPDYNSSVGRVYIFENDGSMPTAAASADDIIDSTGGGDFGGHLAVGDLDGDGDDDLAANKAAFGSASYVYLFYQDGSPLPDAGSADHTITESSTSKYLGTAMEIADFDGDGDEDLAVSATAGGTGGEVYIFYNDGSYPSTPGTADVTLAPGVASNIFGVSLKAADMNNDGTLDVIVGAPGNSTNTGMVYIYYNDGAYGSADDTIAGEASGDRFGDRLAVGDLNGDGKTDLVVGSYYKDTFTGRAYVFYNDGSALPDAASADIIISEEATNNSFSKALAIGDLNGDGVDDLAIGAEGFNSNTGRVYLFYGNREYAWNGLYSYPQDAPSANRPNGFRYDIEGTQSSEEFGKAFAVGDFDGDGINDLAVGAPAYNSNQGRVYLFLNDGDLGMDNSEADVVITGASTSDRFGYSLASGLVNDDDHHPQDTIDDLVVGAPRDSGTGYVYIFDGRTSWNSAISASSQNSTTGYNDRTTFSSGYTCGTDVAVGNFMGDGRDDIIYGCFDYNSDAGIVFVWENDNDYETTSGSGYDEFCWGGTSNGEQFGTSIGGWDYDRDGDLDIVGGAPVYNSSQGRVHVCANNGGVYASTATMTITGESAGDKFGTSVAAGPLKDTRDQWDDLAVGAPGYSSGAGRAYVFYNDGSIPTVAGSADKIITGSSGDGLGQALAIADVSHNGRKDLIMGAPGYSSNRGRVMVSYNDGSLMTSISSMDLFYYGDSSTTGYFGYALAGGDINNDGWEDIITGAYNMDSGKGEANVMTMDAIQFTGYTNTKFGYAYTAGDFNGDGKQDLAVGAPVYNTNEGRVYLFFGNPNNYYKRSSYGSADVVITGSANFEIGTSLAAGDLSHSTAYNTSSDTIDDLLIGAPGSSWGGVFVVNGRTDWADDSSITITSTCSALGTTCDHASRWSSGGTYQCGTKVAAANINSLHTGSYLYRDDILQTCPGSSSGYVFMNFNDGAFNESYGEDYAYGHGYAGDSLVIADFNGDGHNDVAVGDPTYSTNTGRVYIHINKGSWDTSYSYAIQGQATGDEFGDSLSAGDLDGDGTIDLLVGAPGYNTNTGKVYVFYQDATLWGTTSCTTACSAANADEIITHSSTSDYFGQSVLALDITNDGKDDILAGTDDGVYWFYNDSSYPSTTSSADLFTAAAGGYLIEDLAGGDWNGDGRNDFMVIQPTYGTDYGLGILFLGEKLQCEPPTLSSITISDTSGYTNDSTPSITLSVTGGGADPDTMQFSCDDGANWSSEAAYSTPYSSFDITNGATGCTSTNESKTITARVRSVLCGYSNTTSDSTYYDTTAPVNVTMSVDDTSSTQIQLDPGAVSDGSGIGLHSTPYYYTRADGASCSRTYNTGYIATDPYTWGSLSVNTQYSFDFKARDALGQESGYSPCYTLYTAANIPSAPTLATVSTSSLSVDVNVNGNPSSTDFAIRVNGGSYTNWFVQPTGTVGMVIAWQTDSEWGTQTVTGLSADTQYTFDVVARNGDSESSGYGPSASKYTDANTPDTPTVSNETSSSIDVDPVSGGAESAMAIYLDNGTPCDGSGGYGYVQWGSSGSGGISGTESWATDASWTTDFTVTGLSSGTTYYFCVKARNGDDDETAFGSAQPGSTTANPPSYTTLTISDTSGFTNSSNPSITYSGLSGGTPTQHKYSCDNSNWSGYTSYENPTTDFDITSSWYGCGGTTNGTKTVYVILNNSGGDSSAQSDSTYYDTTGPSVTVDFLNNDAYSSDPTKLDVGANTPDDGSGIGDGGGGWEYYFNLYDDPPTCTSTAQILGWSSGATRTFGASVPLSANTAYGTKALARDGLDNIGSYSSCSSTVYTSANAPTTPGHTSQATTSMRWTWASGGSETDFAYGTTSACSTGTTSNAYWDESSLLANTQYTRYACARNADTDKTTALTIGPFYTSANAPTNPAYDTGYIAVDSMRWTWDSGGAQTDYAIDDTDNCASPFAYPTTDYYDDTTTTLPNTSYSRYICARNGDGDLTSDILAVGHTLADPPTNAGTSAIATNSITFTWDAPTGGGGANGYMFSANSDCSSGTLVPSNTYYQDTSCVSANTAYTRYVCSRNNESWVNTDSLTLGPFYTAANTPGIPTLSNVTSATVDVNPVSGGAESAMAIYVADSAVNCNGTDGYGYVTATGSVGAETWQSDAAWDTITVSGASPDTTYYFCTKARNGDGIETDFSTASSETTLSLAFTAGPSDGPSSTTTPTDEGGDVTFTATSNPGRDYWLLVCENGNAPTAGNPPECNGGSGNRIARSSSAVTTNTEASATHSTTGETSESYAWYAFVCEEFNCSSADQGTGDSGSPYNVNHAPTFGTVNIGDTTGGTGTIEPGDTVYINIDSTALTDGDTDGGQDTLSMYVCETSGFTYGASPACTGTEVCHVTGVDPTTTDAECDDSLNPQAPIPTSHGSKNIYVYVLDEHGMASSSGTNSQNYTVQDVAPTFVQGDYTATDNPAPAAGDFDTVDFSVLITDDNGEADVTAAEGYLFDADNVTLSGGACSPDENECYFDSSCDLVTTVGDSSQVRADCQVSVWFNANAGTNWEAHVNPTDELGKVTSLPDSDANVTNAALSGITVVQSSIAYGALSVGATSSGVEVSIGNVGNQTADILLDGTDMAGSISGTSISISQQKFDHSSSTFDWSTGGHTVVSSASGDSNEANGCLNRDIAVRDDHSSSSTNESIWFKLRIPTPQSPGDYAGSNTILYTPASGTGSCTGTLY